MDEDLNTNTELSENTTSEITESNSDEIVSELPDDIPEDIASLETSDVDDIEDDTAGKVPDDIPEDIIPTDDVLTDVESSQITEGTFEMDGHDVHFEVNEETLTEEEAAEWAQLDENTPEVPNDSTDVPLDESSDWTEEDQQLYDNDFGAVNEKVFDYDNPEYLESGKLTPNWGPDSVEQPETIVLPEGTQLIQYSHPGQPGKYFALEGTDYDDLQLPDSVDKRVLDHFEVPEGGLTVNKSKIAVQPWNQTGDSDVDTGALQFTSAEQNGENGKPIAENADDLVAQGKLKRIETPTDKEEGRSGANSLDTSCNDVQSTVDAESDEIANDTLSDSSEIQDIDDIQSWLGDINPNFDEFDPESPYCNNCGSCAYAVYRRLEGDTEIQATDENIGDIQTMNSMTDMEQVPMSPEEIESNLLAQGDGAHAIIGIDRAEGAGHWFNAAVVNGKVVAIDGQTGEISDWPPDYGDVVNWDMSVKKGK